MKHYWLAPALGLIALGCETTGGGGQLDSTVFDTHARIVRLEKNLGGSVDKLNETSAALTAQVSSNDRDMAQLRSMLEENQIMVARLERNLTTLQRTLYDEKGLTMPSSSGYGGGGSVIIEPPVEASPTLRQLSTPPPRPLVDNTPDSGDFGAEPMDTSPVTPAPSSTSDEAAAETAYNTAKAAFEAGNYAQAIEGFQNIIQRYPASSQMARTFFLKARSEHGLGQYIEAIETYERLRREYPASSLVPIAVLNQAVSHAKLGEFDAAKSLWTSLISQYPGNAAAEQAEKYLEQLDQQL